MSAGICLPPETVDKIKQALISGKFEPEKLSSLSSEARHKLFSDVVGEGNAKFINSQFEGKMLLKDKQAGYLRWAKKLTGVTPEIRRDLITRIQKMDTRILDPVEEKQFLKDLASTKLGLDVSSTEAKQITNMSTRLQEFAAKQRKDGTFPTEADRIAYGRAKVAMGSYLADLKNNASKLSFAEHAMHPVQVSGKVAGLAKALKASLDNSAIFRQGWKTLWTNPVIWQKNARQSFIDIAKQLGNKEVLNEIKADIISRPNYDKYQKMGLDIGTVEDEFPTTLPEKIPVLGRVYKASESAYTGFLYRQRADIADKMLEIADKSGVNIKDKVELKSIGKLVNALTGRGDLGGLERSAGAVNNFFFSARFLKSNFDTLTAHTFQKDVTPFVRKQAALNLVKVITGTAAVITTANALKPGSVELDARSKNFGKIKVGHTTFDVTGGMGSFIVLADQLIKQETKSTTTGVVSKLNSGYGSQTGMDVFNNFFENKLSPAATVVKDLMKQQDFSGSKPTVKGEASNLFTPLPVSNVVGNNDPHSANKLLISIADGLGISASTNAPNRNLSQNLTATQQAFKDKVGDAKFEQANNDYNKRYNDWLTSHQSRLNNESESDKAGIISYSKGKIQDDIYKQYNFKPPKPSNNKSLLDKKKSYAN